MYVFMYVCVCMYAQLHVAPKVRPKPKVAANGKLRRWDFTPRVSRDAHAQIIQLNFLILETDLTNRLPFVQLNNLMTD